jgi:hypothetical protein
LGSASKILSSEARKWGLWDLVSLLQSLKSGITASILSNCFYFFPLCGCYKPMTFTIELLLWSERIALMSIRISCSELAFAKLSLDFALQG